MPHPTTPTPLFTPDQWKTLHGLVDWLDHHNGRDTDEITLRLLKLTEETGEVAQAWIGAQGQNPRKGTTHTNLDVADELCDVIITASVALASITDHPHTVLDAKLAATADRSGAAR